MKKFLLFVTAAGLLFVTFGCAARNTTDTVSTDAVSGREPLSYDGEPRQTVASGQLQLSFEEMLAASTNIVVATYTGERETHGIYEDLTFSPERQIKGTGLEAEFHVRNPDGTAGGYAQGETYCLLLEKHVSVYNPYDVYVPLRSTPLKGGEAESLETVLAQTVDTSKTVGRAFIESDDLSEIVRNSPLVAEVVPTALTGSNENNRTERYACDVRSVWKGRIPASEAEILFTAGTVAVGEPYIVLLADPDGAVYYVLSSKKSVYPAEAEIAGQIGLLVGAPSNP